jgi:hypothetical protein
MDMVKNGIFTKNNIWVGTMLGGPLAGGYYLYRNFKIFNNSLNAKLSLLLSILITIFLLFVANSIPENVPRSLIPVIYTGIIYIIATYSQGKTIDEYIEQKKELAGWRKTIVISLVCLFITAGLYFIPKTASYYKHTIDNVPELDTATVSKDYGIQKIYFNGDLLNEEDIDKTADILYDFGIFNDNLTVFVYINNEDDIFTIYFKSVLLRRGIEKLYGKLQEEFPDKKIKIRFFKNRLDNIGAEIYSDSNFFKDTSIF